MLSLCKVMIKFYFIYHWKVLNCCSLKYSKIKLHILMRQSDFFIVKNLEGHNESEVGWECLVDDFSIMESNCFIEFRSQTLIWSVCKQRMLFTSINRQKHFARLQRIVKYVTLFRFLLTGQFCFTVIFSMDCKNVTPKLDDNFKPYVPLIQKELKLNKY
jgi:hypothetical protein